MKKTFFNNNTSPKFRFLIICLLFSTYALSQNSEEKYLDHEKERSSLIVRTDVGEYHLKFYTPEIIEKSFVPSGETLNQESYSAILEPQPDLFTVVEENDSLNVDSEGIDIKINKKPFQIIYFYNGEIVTSENSRPAGVKGLENIDFNVEENEKFFVGGSGELGKNLRGNRIGSTNSDDDKSNENTRLLNKPTQPVIFSSNKYIIHFTNAPTEFLDLDSEKTNTITYQTTPGKKSYHLIVGNSWENLIENYTLLTGRQPMPPRWTFGNLSGIFHTQKGVTETIQKFRENSIPVEAVIINLRGYNADSKDTILKNPFPDPENLISELKSQKINTVLVATPFILANSSRWKEAVDNDVLIKDSKGKPVTLDFSFGKSGVVDLLKPESRDWWWKIHQEYAEMGIAGWAGNFRNSEVKISDISDRETSPHRWHYAFDHYMAKLIYEGYRTDFPEQRAYVIKDFPSGGFGRVNQNEIDIRGLQNSVFQPVFISAAPVLYSSPQLKEQGVQSIKKAVELRYKLLPYNYTLAFENSRNGLPFIRPPFFEEPENNEIYNHSGTYFWGNDFLISPVLDTTTIKKEVYFPGSGNWFDFYTGKKYKGGSKDSVSIQEDHIPTWVRGGAFIPMSTNLSPSLEESEGNLDIHYYYDNEVKQSEGLVYLDDGNSPDSYDKGKSEILNLTSSGNPNTLTITVEKKDGENSDPTIQQVNIIIENLNRSVDVVWVRTLRFTSKNYMHQGKLVIPVRFDQPQTTIKLEFSN